MRCVSSSGSQKGAAPSDDHAWEIPRKAAPANAVIFTSDLAASTKPLVPNIRFSPRRGSSRPRSGAMADTRSRNPVCNSTAAAAAVKTIPAMGPTSSMAARTDWAIAIAGSCEAGSTSKSRNRPTKARPSEGPSMTKSSAAAPSPASDVSSRETGTLPSSRAFCNRRGVAACVRSAGSLAIL